MGEASPVMPEEQQGTRHQARAGRRNGSPAKTLDDYLLHCVLPDHLAGEVAELRGEVQCIAALEQQIMAM